MKVIYDGENGRAFKEVLGETIQRLAEADPDVVYLDADLMGCINMAGWAGEHPDRAVNCGIAEANMIGIAAGMSAVGWKPIVHTFGCFASRRCYDQIFLSGGYAGNSVTVIGTDPGVCAAFNGGTHMPFEDMALYRAIPGAYVFGITDEAMLEGVLPQCVDLPGVKYLRVGRKSSPKVYEKGVRPEIGKGIVVTEKGQDAVIFACGLMVAKALEAAEILEREGIRIAVVDLFSVKPRDEELVAAYAERTGAAVTAENHNKIGGLYSAVSEVLGRRCPIPVEYVAVEDEFGEVGPQDYLEERFGLTAAHLAEKTREAVRRKTVKKQNR